MPQTKFPQSSTKTTAPETGDLDLSAAQYGDPEVEAACRAALRRAVDKLNPDQWVAWSDLRRRLPRARDFERESAMIRLCREGVIVALKCGGRTWIKLADEVDRLLALQAPQTGGRTAGAYIYD